MLTWKVKNNLWYLLKWWRWSSPSPSSSSARKLKRVERQSATAISVLTASACDATEWMGPFHYKCTFVQKVKAILQILTNAKTMQNNSFFSYPIAQLQLQISDRQTGADYANGSLILEANEEFIRVFPFVFFGIWVGNDLSKGTQSGKVWGRKRQELLLNKCSWWL